MNSRLLNRGPATTDALGGSHQRVANAIADLVSTLNGGKSIAILGGWGTGKSTVVELIRSRFASDQPSQTRVFVFDAWAHQGDPLRRSFLEEAINFLWTDPCWLSSEGHERIFNKLLSITGRKETVETTTRRGLTGWGNAVALTGILAAALCTVLPKWDPNHGPALFLWIQGGALATPIAIAFTAWLWQKYQLTRDPEGFKKTYHSDRAQTVYQLLLRDSEEVKTATTDRNPEPTSIQFKALFGELLKEALTSNRKLIVVVDNLDRVDAADALSMWNNLRVIFDSGGQGSHWLESFWLVVPMDPKALSRLWKSDDALLTNDFLGKTFDVVYHIPRPTITRRRDFFVDHLKVAIPSLNPSERQVIYRLTDRYSKQLESPRDMKRFVNRLTTLHLQWSSEGIEPELLALYILHATSCEGSAIQRDMQGEIISQTPKDFDFNVGDNVLELLPDASRTEWQSKLGAVHFNVDIRSAGEVADGPELLRALENGDTATLIKLRRRSWFWAVCLSVVKERAEWWTTESDSWANATTSLYASGAAASDRDVAHEIHSVWQDLAQIGAAGNPWRALTPEIISSVQILRTQRLRTQLTDKLVSKLARTIHQTPPGPTERPANPDSAPPPFEAWVSACCQAWEAFGNDPAWRDARVELDPERMAWALIHVYGETGPSSIDRFQTSDRTLTLVHLMNIGWKTPVGGEYFDLLRYLSTFAEWPTASVDLDRTAPWDQAPSPSSSSVARYIRALLTLHPAKLNGPFLRQKYTEISFQPQLKGWIETAVGPFEKAWIATPKIAATDGNGNIEFCPELCTDPPSHELAHALFDVFRDLKELRLAIHTASLGGGRALGKAILTEIIDHGLGGQLGDTFAARPEPFNFMRELLDREYQKKLVSQLMGDPWFVATLGFRQNVVSICDLIPEPSEGELPPGIRFLIEVGSRTLAGIEKEPAVSYFVFRMCKTFGFDWLDAVDKADLSARLSKRTFQAQLLSHAEYSWLIERITSD